MALSAPTQAGLYWARKRRRAPFVHAASGMTVNFTRHPSIDDTFHALIEIFVGSVYAAHDIPFAVTAGMTTAAMATAMADAINAEPSLAAVTATATGSSVTIAIVGGTIQRYEVRGERGYSIIGSMEASTPEPVEAVNGLFLGSRALVRNDTVYEFLDCDLGPPSARRYVGVFCYLADVILGLPVVRLNGAIMTASATSARITTGGHQTSLHMLALPDGESATIEVTASDSAGVCGIQWWRLSGFDPATGVNVLPAVLNETGGNASVTDTLAAGDLMIACGLAAKTSPATPPTWDADVTEQDTIHIAGGTYMTMAARRIPPYTAGAVTADMTSLGGGSSILGVRFSP